MYRAVMLLLLSTHQHVFCCKPLPKAGISRLGHCRNQHLTASPLPQTSQGPGYTTRISSSGKHMEAMGLSYRKRVVLAKTQL